MLKIVATVTSLKGNQNYAKCPRCWRYVHEGIYNHDNLCDRCCNVLISINHESKQAILLSYQNQRFTFLRSHNKKEEK